jgi:uncharacterized protein YhaN
MYIESIAIESFGSYKNYSLSFDSGINIIEGPNEAGKTTLGAFIKFIFYGLSRKSSGTSALAESRRYRSWDDDLASGSLTFSEGGKKYRIERKLRSGAKTGGETLKIVDVATGIECFKGEHPGKLFFGVDEDTFAQTAFVGQTDGSRVNGKTVSAAIENMLFAGDETVSVSSAQKKLDEARIVLRHKVRRGGRIYELEDSLDSLTKRLENAKSENKIVMSKECEERELVERLDVEKNELDIISHRLERAAEREKLERLEYYGRLNERVNEKKEEYQAALDGASYEGFVPDNAYITSVENLRTKLGYVDTQIKQTQDDREALGADKLSFEDRAFLTKVKEDGGLDKIREKVAGFSGKRRMGLFGGVVSIVFGVLFAVLAVLCLAVIKDSATTVIKPLGLSAMLTGICCAVLALAFGLGAAFMLVFASSSGNKLALLYSRYLVMSVGEIEDLDEAVHKRAYEQDVHDEKIITLDGKYKKLIEEKDRLESDMTALFGKWGKDQGDVSCEGLIVAARETIALLNEKSSELDKARSACEAFAPSVASYDRQAIVDYLESTAIYGDIGDGLTEEAKIRLAEREASVRALSDELHLLEVDIARLSASLEDPTELLTEIERISAEREKLEFCFDAYMLAQEAIGAAATNLRDDIAPRLAMQASRVMGRQTGGKYQQIGVGEDLSLAYGVDTSGVGNIVTREIDYLSEGTKDLAYISLRIALVGLLFDKAKPPIIFDESFARLDDTRLKSTLTSLEEVASSGCQIFLFTSQKRDAVIMKKVGEAKHILLGEKQ